MPAAAVSEPGSGESQGRPAGRKSFRSCDLNMVTQPLLSEPGSSPVTRDAGINLNWSYPTEVSAVRGNQGGIAGERKPSLVPERDEFFVPAPWVE